MTKIKHTGVAIRPCTGTCTGTSIGTEYTVQVHFNLPVQYSYSLYRYVGPRGTWVRRIGLCDYGTRTVELWQTPTGTGTVLVPIGY